MAFFSLAESLKYDALEQQQKQQFILESKMQIVIDNLHEVLLMIPEEIELRKDVLLALHHSLQAQAQLEESEDDERGTGR